MNSSIEVSSQQDIAQSDQILCGFVSGRSCLGWVTISLADKRWVDLGSVDSNERTVRDCRLVDIARNAIFIPMKNDGAEAHQSMNIFCDSRRAPHHHSGSR